MITLADILEALTQNRPVAPQIISEASVDSRQVIPAGLFVALQGENANGHNFLPEAFQRGAQAALVEQDLSALYPTIDLRSGMLPAILPSLDEQLCILVPNTLLALQSIARFWRTKLNVKVIGITGSVGKSTTKELISEVLSQKYCVLKNIGNLNNEIGLPLTLLRLTENHQKAVLEMGFYVPGEIRLLCDIAKPEVGVVTNVGTVHAERAGSQEEIARGKGELVEALPAGGTAILNYDDPWVRSMAAKTQANVFFYGLDPKAHLWADEIEGLGLQGIRFRLHYGNEDLHVRVPLIGRHSVHTILRAAAVGLVEKMSWQEIILGLQQGNSQLRMAVVTSQTGAMILDDTYNASPDSVMAALNLLEELQGDKCAVLGEMLELGPYEQQGHQMVGVRAAQIVSRLVTVGEKARIIAESAHTAGLPQDVITWVPTVSDAIQLLQGSLKQKDVVLIKGSHSLHMEQIVNALEVDS
jgi:UDP-N-acetylmuramoyl-tripeptide--D-alanyl-D-alanine ligase